MKDGPKNHLRDQDIHRIVDVFTRQLEVPRYARMVSFDEIEKNDFNLKPAALHRQSDAGGFAGHLRPLAWPAMVVVAMATEIIKS